MLRWKDEKMATKESGWKQQLMKFTMINMNDSIALGNIQCYFATDRIKWFLHDNSIGMIFARDQFGNLERYLHDSYPSQEE